MLGIKNMDLLQRLQHYSVGMEVWKWCLYENWHSSPLNTRAKLWAGLCVSGSCMAANNSTELWHLKILANLFVWICFNNKPSLKLNQNVNNVKGTSRSDAFFLFCFSCGQNVMEAAQRDSLQRKVSWAGQALPGLVSFRTKEKEEYLNLS